MSKYDAKEVVFLALLINATACGTIRNNESVLL